eukprot:TRINITY_DN18549_c0_g2_i1.p2 TRINITY_DN18549_c0_g2~~TRINITY_DN18549_c0_g2_i1.p2  ORF type:complete len:298 (-),score=80.30 TRINITY_DN18549_c0_g2_i1:17-910(-)
MQTPATASSGHFTTNDGVRLHYLEAGQGPPLVMLPGWTQPGATFAKQHEDFSSSFRCLALDHRGHGESQRPGHGFRVSRLARDCLDFLDHLGLNEVVLLGHSAGCTVIWSLLELFGQDRVRALIFCDEMVACVKRPQWSEEECRQYGALAGAQEALDMAAAIAGTDGEQVVRDFLGSCFGPEFPKADLERVITDSLKVPRPAAAQMVLSVMQSDYRDLLPLIRRPTLCLGGRESHLGAEVMPWIASRIPGARAVMFDTRHFVYLEDPAGFNAAVRSFLEGLAQAACHWTAESRPRLS